MRSTFKFLMYLKSRASGKSIEAQKINHAVDKFRVVVNRRYQEMMQTDGYKR